jgi:hypothetical protein
MIQNEMDVARVCNPKLDNFMHFHAPNSPEVLDLFIPGDKVYQADISHLDTLYQKPEGRTERTNLRNQVAAVRTVTPDENR